MPGDADIAAVGALIGDRARTRILAALGDGRALAASVLAVEAGDPPPPAPEPPAPPLAGGPLPRRRPRRPPHYPPPRPPAAGRGPPPPPRRRRPARLRAPRPPPLLPARRPRRGHAARGDGPAGPAGAGDVSARGDEGARLAGRPHLLRPPRRPGRHEP